MRSLATNCDASSDSQAPLEVRNEHLDRERRVRSISILYWFGSLLFFVSILGAVSEPEISPSKRLLAAIGLLLTGIVQIVTGFGLLNLAPISRIPAAVISGFFLFLFPVGTLINGYILYLIFSAEGRYIFSREYAMIVKETPAVKVGTSAYPWIIVGFFALLIVLAFTLGLVLAMRYS